MTKAIWMIIVGLVFAAQLGIPAWMVATQEIALSRGTEYRLLCAPVDPYDFFRGRYVAIQIRQSDAPLRGETTIHPGQRVYAALGVDENGFAYVRELHETPPQQVDYIPVRVAYVYEENAHIQYPFDRYYMNEHLAPEAERVYWESALETNVSLAVRVYRGNAIVAGLFIENQPIEDYLKEHAQSDE